MTIPVSVAQLPAAMERFQSAVLITSAGDDWPRIITVDPVMDGEIMLVHCPHQSALARVRENRHVTLVWQPLQHHGMTLIVDGWADVDGETLRVTIDHGMLHRPAAHADGPDWEPLD